MIVDRSWYLNDLQWGVCAGRKSGIDSCISQWSITDQQFAMKLCMKMRHSWIVICDCDFQSLNSSERVSLNR